MNKELKANADISHYRIVSKIGAGGMGEVYLAEDTKLDRKVALKVLPAEVAQNADRMQRFIREAKAASSLNHPNIAHIYEIGEADGVSYLAMELVDGVTLREKIHGGKTDLRTLLKYLAQVADGLAKAHASGIVHRDLKPDNIMISSDGFAKILDFGLAKLVESAPQADTEDATAMMQPQLSMPGVIMGTAGYMSPEQAKGKAAIDQRSDIFSFGCVLFEAATRQQPFTADSVIDTLHKIINAPAPLLRDLRPDSPPDLQRVVRRCLAKDPEDRYQTIKDVSTELKEIRREMKADAELHYSSMPSPQINTVSNENATAMLSGVHSTQTSVGPQLSSAEYIVSEIKRHKTGLIGVLILVIALVAGGGYGIYRFSNKDKPAAPSAQLKISRLVTGLGNIGNASISPDGKYVAYELDKDGKASLHVRQVSTGSDREIVAAVEDGSFTATVFSPDGELVYYNYVQREKSPLGTLYQIPVIGGREPQKILEHLSQIIGFAPDGKRFAFRRDDLKTGDSFLMIGSLDGGEPHELAKRRGNDWFTGSPAWSPDGRVIVCPVGTDTGGTQFSLVEVPVEGGPEHRITTYNWHGIIWRPFWLKDGSGLVVNAADHPSDPMQIWNVSYPGGAVTRITNDLTQYGTTSFGLTADSTTIVSIAAEISAQIWLATPNEDETRARKLTSGNSDGLQGLDWTPDGRIVYSAQTGDTLDIWSINADGSGRKQLTSNEDLESNLTVSPDGRYILFTSNRGGGTSHIWRTDIDGGNPKQLTQGDFADFAPICSTDSNTVVFNSYRSGSDRLWKVPINGGESGQVSELPLQASGFLPDGKLMLGTYFDTQVSPPRRRPALLSLETGQLIKVFDLRKKAGAWLMTDEHTLVYQEQRGDVDNLWTVPVDGGTPKQLTKFTSQNIFGFKLSRDGKRFAIARGTASSDIILIKGFR